MGAGGSSGSNLFLSVADVLLPPKPTNTSTTWESFTGSDTGGVIAWELGDDEAGGGGGVGSLFSEGRGTGGCTCEGGWLEGSEPSSPGPPCWRGALKP